RYGKRVVRPFLDPEKDTTMKNVAALSILAAIATAGCATPEMIAAQQAAQLREDEAHCGSLGFRLGTDSFKLCLLNLQQGRDIYHQGYSAGYSSGYNSGKFAGH
ncbi:MAG: hypothetical protein ACRECZ_06180, partial [Methylocella sp.]